MNGVVKVSDEPSAWGLSVGDDGALYVLRGAQLPGPPPRVDEPVVFEPQPAPGGLRASGVRRIAAGG